MTCIHGSQEGSAALAAQLDRGAALDDAGDRRGPTLGRLLEGISKNLVDNSTPDSGHSPIINRRSFKETGCNCLLLFW
jgi:hypothetical protein